MAMIFVAINERGRRIGEGHPRARLSDYDVQLVLTLRDDFGLGYGSIADKFEVARATIRKICKGETRAQFPAQWKRLGG